MTADRFPVAGPVAFRCGRCLGLIERHGSSASSACSLSRDQACAVLAALAGVGDD